MSMGSYTIHHPGPAPLFSEDGYINEHYNYCTQLMVNSLRKILIDNNHEVNIMFHSRHRRRRLSMHNDLQNNEDDSSSKKEFKKDADGNLIYDDGNLVYPTSVDIHIDELNLHAPRCPNSLWFILANNETKKFILFDLQDSPAAAYNMLHHENLIFVFTGQFSYERLRNEIKSPNIYKFIPFVYTAYYPKTADKLFEEIQEIRKNTKQLDDRIFFYGNNRDTYVHSDPDGVSQKIREVISVLAEKYPDESCVGSWEAKLPLEDFFKKAATHTINLALPGHPWCSREHELWTLGLPVMMYEHTHHTAVNLIPNYHYVAVPAGRRLSIGMAKDPELAADRIIETHREWIKPENRWRLDAVAHNGRERIINKANYDTVWNEVLPLLQLNHW